MRRLTAFAVAVALILVAAAPVRAAQFEFPVFGQSVKGTLDTTFTMGAAWRMEQRSPDLLGKSDINPNVCGVVGNIQYQSCQGDFRDQIYPAARLGQVPGQYSMHADDGDLNYGKGDLISAVAKITPTLKLQSGDFGFFGRFLFFYDGVNNNFSERHPDMITPQNRLTVGDSDPLVLSSSVGGMKVYGPGGSVRLSRRDGPTLKEVGSDAQFLDSYVFGKVNILGKPVTIKLGRQTVNWGESTSIVFDSINSVNPVNANNFYRVGESLDEVFTPVAMAFASFEPFPSATLEGFYQFEWKNLESPPPGSYFSNVDVGTNNAGPGGANLSFGGSADDPSRVGLLLDNPLANLTNTTAWSLRLPDKGAPNNGQFGIKFDYYADSFNDGTDIAFYYEHLHSRVPFVSFMSMPGSCARAGGVNNTLGIDATSTVTFLGDCPNLPAVNPLNPAAATSSLVALDAVRFFLEYPQNIHLFGVSFNTTFHGVAFQGEVSYQPNRPMQVSVADVQFAAAQPGLTRCGEVGTNCTGSVGAGLENQPAGGQLPHVGSSDFIPAPGQTGFADTFDIIEGAIPGSARAFPSFVVSYRGGTEGEVAPNSYVRGYERFGLVQAQLGATKILGATENPIKASQVILVFDGGADFIPDLPPIDRLQIDGPATFLSASAGADGSGANGSRLACAGVRDCSFGADGLRFNPHQQRASAFVHQVSWGYRLISFVRYESVLPDINVEPFFYFQHDVQGTSPGPAFNFVSGRKQMNVLVETRYKSALSLTVGYTWFWGGGDQNLMADRDYLQTFLRYQF